MPQYPQQHRTPGDSGYRGRRSRCLVIPFKAGPYSERVDELEPSFGEEIGSRFLLGLHHEARYGLHTCCTFVRLLFPGNVIDVRIRQTSSAQWAKYRHNESVRRIQKPRGMIVLSYLGNIFWTPSKKKNPSKHCNRVVVRATNTRSTIQSHDDKREASVYTKGVGLAIFLRVFLTRTAEQYA